MATVVNQQTMTDAELIGASRTGDPDAYAELYRRHVDAARAAARALCRNRSDADDVVSEAFAKLLRVLQNGNGPDVAFRPYLLTAVRNCFYDKMRRSAREEPVDRPTEELDLTLLDGAGSDDNKTLAAAAFATLPERWQLVLWHTEVEGRNPAEVAPLLGLAPNAVAALAYRAREGLRQAYLQAHLRTPRASDCRDCAGNLGAHVRDGLSARDRRKVDDHLSGCASCQGLLIELTETNTTLRAALIPAIVGVPAAAYLSGLGGKGALAWFARLPRRQQAGVGAGAAAAAAVLAVVAAAIVSAGGNTPTVAAPTTTRPVTATSTTVEPTSVIDAVPPTITIASVVTTPSATSIVRSLPPVAPASPVSTVTPSRRVTPVTVPTTAGSTTVPSTTTSAAPGTTTTAPTTTTTAPTTTIPVVARLSMTSTQLGSALIGGQARVQVSIAANVLPTNQFRINAFPNLVVSIALPAGVTVAAAENPAWSCTAQGTCTVSSLVSGSASTAVLKLGIDSTAQSPIAFAPTVIAPANAIVQSTPLSIVAVPVPGLVFQEFERGSVAAVGNTVLDCSKECTYVGGDVKTATINSSTADLSFTGTVAKAVLVWSGDSATAGRNTVRFLTPDGAVDVVADNVAEGYGSAYADAYVAYQDVTAQITASGTYGVANLQTSLRSYGGWSLIVVVHDSTQPERSLMVAVPVGYVDKATPLKVTAPGAPSAPTADLHLVVAAFEGDGQFAGDTATVNGLDLGPNPFRGAISGSPRNPELAVNYRVDVLDATVTDVGAGDVTVAVATADDLVMVAAVGMALDLT